MDKQLKDYLHLYLGCEMACHKDFIPNSREESTRGEGFCILTPDLLSDIDRNRLEYGTPHFKPILRPLSDMTEEEAKEAYTIRGKNAFHEFTGETVKYLLFKHFDLFDLIESGHAIDKTTL